MDIIRKLWGKERVWKTQGKGKIYRGHCGVPSTLAIETDEREMGPQNSFYKTPEYMAPMSSRKEMDHPARAPSG